MSTGVPSSQVPPPPLPLMRWIGRGLGLVVVWLTLWLMFDIGEGDVHPVLLAIVIVSVAGVASGAQRLGMGASAIDWTPTYVSAASLRAAQDPRFSRLSRLLGEATDRVTVRDEVHRTLRQIAAERLARRHDIDLEREPERARPLVGDELYRYLTSPSHRIRGNEAATLSRLLTRIEAL